VEKKPQKQSEIKIISEFIWYASLQGNKTVAMKRRVEFELAVNLVKNLSGWKKSNESRGANKTFSNFHHHLTFLMAGIAHIVLVRVGDRRF